MSAIYDNWERLAAAVLKKQQLWELFHQQSRSPSILSGASDLSSSFHLSSPLPLLKKQQLWELFHQQSRSPSILSGSSDLSSSVHLSSPLPLGQQIEDAIAELQQTPPELVLISDFSPAFDHVDVFLASSKLIGRGTFGSAYVAANENGVKFVVKRLMPVNISEPEFKRHMEIFGNVRHENVAALRAYYYSKEEKLMLYDYYSHGSVFALLHGHGGENLNRVDWETRLRIAIGAARGITEIHSQNGGKLVHGNIKSSNIFLNPQHCGCVSDHGLRSMIAAALMPNAWCHAPEVKNTLSQASDVYSFGILLLELLTRKPPVHVPGGPEAVDLVKLVNSVKSKEWTAEVFDADLFRHLAIREHIVKLLQIGISCAAESPQKRPKMSEVVKMLEGLWTMSTGSSVALEPYLVFVGKGVPTYSLQDILSATPQLLGSGMFGSSHKAILNDGDTTIRVKRLKDVNMTFKDFQQRMEVIEKMRHENVAKLRAYFFSKVEKLMIYDYQSEDSLFALLHENKEAGRRALGWESRLKIAVGAARGVAHIHRQDGEKLVHGNVTSLNIFLNRQLFGLVSDAGLAKLASPVRRSAMRNHCYCAPEVRDTWNVSQASEVYSFGVVLLELVSGKPSQYNTGYGKVLSLVTWTQSVVLNEQTAHGVLDVELLRYQNEEERMMQVLQIAMDCVHAVPERRPKMSQVLKMLEEISGTKTEDLLTESRLEDFLPGLTL